ncbi:MAG: ABC transporter permease subunit, partial [Dehalococcoidia bacterium]|nr:ABC transporter permease subunit [Dehalococcoidia bacterium]
MTIGSVTMAAFFLFGMAVYRDIDLAFYDDFPEAVRSMMNIPEGAGVGSLAYGAIYGLYGALVLAVLAMLAGSASIAGEERNGTLGLLLGNPKSRTHVLISKATALVFLAGLVTVVMWGAGRVVPLLLDVEV